MKQEEKQLLLKDLCARLPYRPISVWKHTVNGVETHQQCEVTLSDVKWLQNQEDFKLVLFPLSALTQEITIAGERFAPAIRIARLIDNQHNHDDSKVSSNSERIRVYTEKCDDVYDAIIKTTEYGLVYMSCVGDLVTSTTVRKIDSLLLQWHFDINGLIDKGLAVSVYSLDKNPYE